jgi:hypothetical protein
MKCDECGMENITEHHICPNETIGNKSASVEGSVLCNVGLCGKWDNFGKLRLIHDDFTHDMMITLSGDFTDEEVAEKYLEKIKDKLNAA